MRLRSLAPLHTFVSARFPASLVLAAIALAPGPLARTSDAAEPTRLTTTGAEHPTVSSDGTWIAFRRLTGGISKISADGTQLVSLSSFGMGPDWSWVHDLLAISDGVNIGTLDPNTLAITPLSAALTDGPPAWSPIGDEIAVRTTSGGDGIYLIAYPGGAPTVLPCTDQFGGGCDGEGPTWSPDGEWIAFEDGLEILKVRRAGGTAEVVVEGLNDVTEPAWSPSGEWIAFVMEDETFSNTHIWAADARGASFGLMQVTSGEAHDRVPTWSPGSDRIYFDSDRSGTTEIWSVPFGSGAPEARAFLFGGHRTIAGFAGAPRTCIQLEPVAESFALQDVDVATVRLVSSGTGAVGSIPSAGTKMLAVSDTDRNGVPELSVCFSRADLAQLFSGIAERQVVEATLEGSLHGGGSFSAPISLNVVGPGAGVQAAAIPNPMLAGGTLRVWANDSRSVSVEVFDVHGMRVRNLRSTRTNTGTGVSLPFDGRDEQGRALASGIYHYRVSTDAGRASGRFVLVR